MQENQARRLLNDLDSYRASLGDPADVDEEIAAHRWVTEVFEPVVRAVPRELRGKLEPAEVFHEVLEHRWFLSERLGRGAGLMPTVRSYVADVLTQKPDEEAVLGSRIGTPTQELVALDGPPEDELLPADPASDTEPTGAVVPAQPGPPS